jgi:hypothetical protein
VSALIQGVAPPVGRHCSRHSRHLAHVAHCDGAWHKHRRCVLVIRVSRRHECSFSRCRLRAVSDRDVLKPRLHKQRNTPRKGRGDRFARGGCCAKRFSGRVKHRIPLSCASHALSPSRAYPSATLPHSRSAASTSRPPDCCALPIAFTATDRRQLQRLICDSLEPFLVFVSDAVHIKDAGAAHEGPRAHFSIRCRPSPAEPFPEPDSRPRERARDAHRGCAPAAHWNLAPRPKP